MKIKRNLVSRGQINTRGGAAPLTIPQLEYFNSFTQIAKKICHLHSFIDNHTHIFRTRKARKENEKFVAYQNLQANF